MILHKMVTRSRLAEVGLENSEIESILHQYRLADARLWLLRDIVKGESCENPQKYLMDCGKCIVCRCRYHDGALVSAAIST